MQDYKSTLRLWFVPPWLTHTQTRIQTAILTSYTVNLASLKRYQEGFKDVKSFTGRRKSCLGVGCACALAALSRDRFAVR